jgi:hypothetical protein
MSDAEDHERPVQVEFDISEGRTVLTLAGQRNAAVVVRSESGERIYLPPEEDGGGQQNTYRPTGDAESPYDGLRGEDTPYGSARQQDASLGMTPTADGFRIVHDEPVTDVRVLR